MPAVRKSVSLPAIVALLLAVAATLVLLRPRSEPAAAPHPDSVSPEIPDSVSITGHEPSQIESPIRFALLPADETGIHFADYANPGARYDISEQNGTGVSIFDFDGDGHTDLFFVNGPQYEMPAEQVRLAHRLFRATGPIQFKDVTQPAGLEAFGGQGCAAADYDNDGFQDLFVAGYGPNRLWHNNGDGTFTDVTQDSVVGDERWASSAAFADLDGDGNLDLYVVNYMDWTPVDADSRFPGPTGFDGLPDLLYRNSADGRFEEVVLSAGISIPVEGNGLAVGIGDLNADRRPDIYVANDATRNFLFRNLGGMRFEEIGVSSGVAVSQHGSIGSGMGVGLCDYNGDGRPDLFVTNFFDEVVDAFTNIGAAGFVANNAELGIDTASRHVLNFGIVLADFDLDLWPDLFFANGHLWNESGSGGEYEMHPTLLRNAGGKRFVDVSTVAGEYFRQRWLGRGAACGDLDNDGDSDLVISHLLAAPAILRNDSDRAGHSIRVQFIGTRSSRQPLGSRVETRLKDGRELVAYVPSGRSFQVSHDPVLVIPTGTAGVIDRVSISWPDGTVETWNDLSADQTIRLIEGTGRIQE